MKTFFQFVGLLFFNFIFSALNAQTLEEEIGFLYVKAEYLSETGRFDEAVSNYNKVITRDSLYKDVFLKRGLAKFSLGAFKGSKMDALQFINLKGITAESAALLARSFAALGQTSTAISTITAAIGIAPENNQYYAWRAEMYESDEQLASACKDFETAARLGNVSAASRVVALCGGYVKPKPTQPEVQVSTEPKDTNIPETPNQTSEPAQEVPSNPSGVVNNQNNEATTPPQDGSVVTHIEDSEPVQNENIPKDDGTVNNIVIDDEVNIEISGQELGKRATKEIPSILILSEENGRVTVNICVDREGVVTRAEFNSALSTIALKSLVNLALRKAKEFEFKPGKYDLQCGIMVFNIKGS